MTSKVTIMNDNNSDQKPSIGLPGIVKATLMPLGFLLNLNWTTGFKEHLAYLITIYDCEQL